MSIEVTHREDIGKEAAHVELVIGNSRSLYITNVSDCTSVVLVDQDREEQASILVEDGELEARAE